jgi:hypothetical protein
LPVQFLRWGEVRSAIPFIQEAFPPALYRALQILSIEEDGFLGGRIWGKAQDRVEKVLVGSGGASLEEDFPNLGF